MRALSFPIEWYQNATIFQRRRLGISIFVCCLVIFLTRDFFHDQGVVKTALQVDFEQYVEQYEKGSFTRDNNSFVLPKIYVTIQTGVDGSSRHLLIDPQTDQSAGGKITRVLSLAREAGVFGLNHPTAIVGEGVTLRIEDGKKNFTTSFSRQDIVNNVKAESLLKLLTIHGKPVA